MKRASLFYSDTDKETDDELIIGNEDKIDNFSSELLEELELPSLSEGSPKKNNHLLMDLSGNSTAGKDLLSTDASPKKQN